ncbi:MAG: UDP-N-acetylmuramoyl-L-alanine--D-glutamate ligase, partial [Candidatus Helarchaeota archaeon]
KPFSEYVSMTATDGIAILEISSFQLETIHTFHPKIAVIMNLTDNHLDRYQDFESYATAKLNILKNMTSEDVLIFNADDDHLVRSLTNVIPRKLIFSLSQHDREGVYWRDDIIFLRINAEEKRIPLKNYQLRGIHNRYNMMVAALIASLLDVPDNIIVESIEQFEGIEHRLEMVREYQGVVFVNDSKATTVDSLAWALQSFDEKIVLIVGGKDKGGDFRRVVPLLKKHVRAAIAILIGKAANRIQSVWNGVIPLFRAESLKEAVEKAFRQAQKGDVVLLSPACSSFDMFRDYEDRGRQFKQAVRELN